MLVPLLRGTSSPLEPLKRMTNGRGPRGSVCFACGFPVSLAAGLIALLSL